MKDPMKASKNIASVGHPLDPSTIEGMKETMVIDPETTEKRPTFGFVNGR